MQIQSRTQPCGAAKKQHSAAGVRAPAPARPVPGHFVQPASSPCSTQQRFIQARAAADPVNKEKYDVFVNDPKPLKEGEEKHIISVFVADEPGLINRVAGVFARRGANIESLAVGLTKDKALFTIVVTGTSQTVANLVKQVGKLVKVRYVEDITHIDRVEREMLLLKLRAPPGPARTEVLQLAQIFRARVVDVSDRSLTLCVSGDPGKCAAMCKVMYKFGISEIARTGRVSLLRGERTLEPGSNAEAAARRAASVAVGGSPAPFTSEARAADVYQVDDVNAAGVWEVDNILDATFDTASGDAFEAHTLNIEVQDVPGVLNQVTSVFARRGYNVQSLAVGPSEREGMSRICMVVPGTGPTVAKLLRQLEKLVFVQNVTDLTPEPFVNRELMLVKVRCTASQRGELRDLATIFRADVLDVSHNSLTIEILGKQDKMKGLTDLLEPYGIMEIARTGRVAVARDSGVDSKYLEQFQSQRIY